MEFKLPQTVDFLLKTLNDAGYEAYAVGGCVRDLLRGEIPNDWDITTSALPEQTKACFSGYRIIETGMQHGTIAILLEGDIYEITTYRMDGAYIDSRHPQSVEFVGDIVPDLSRRDFTVNAMAYHPQLGLCDPFLGQSDLNAKILRCVGDPTARFEEDALRIMRAIRFASVLGYTIEAHTAAAIHAQKDNLNRIARERIRVELCKLLCGGNVKAVLCDYFDVITTVIPQLMPSASDKEALASTIAAAESDETVRLALLLESTDAKTVLTRLRFDRKTVDTVSKLISHLQDPLPAEPIAAKKLLAMLGEQDYFRLLAIQTARGVKVKEEQIEKLQELATVWIAQGTCLSIAQLAVTGADLKAIGIPQGKRIGESLNALLDAVITEQVENEKCCLLAYANKLADHEIG